MAHERSQFTQVALNVAEALKAKDKRIMKARPVPFGMERAGLDAVRERIRAMTVQERAAMVQQIGLTEALKLFKPYGRDDGSHLAS